MKQNLFVITVILILSFALFIPVSAQLSKEDIEELKKRAIEENWTFEVGENSATNYSVEELCGTVEPDNWQETANFKSITTKIWTHQTISVWLYHQGAHDDEPVPIDIKIATV